VSRLGRLSLIAGACFTAPLLFAALLRTGGDAAALETVPPSAEPRQGFAVPAAESVSDFRTAVWAPMTRAVWSRRSPKPDAPQLVRVRLRTPEDTTNLVQILDHKRHEASGRVWLKVRLTSLPNGQIGWIPRNAVGGQQSVETKLLVDTKKFSAELIVGGRAVLKVPVGVGQAISPTPLGEFYVRNKLTRYRSPFYGPLAFGTSARSNTLTDWPAGGHIGIHGTNRPDLIPGRISHGCIRLRNPDLVRLGELMPIGTPLEIQ